MRHYSRLSSIKASFLAGSFLMIGCSHLHAEDFTFKISSGHAANWHFVELTRDFFIPEVKRRAEEAGHNVNFVEGWGGTVVKPTEVLEATQAGIIDFGLYCICHEAQKLQLHNFPMYLPFGPSDARISVPAARRVYDEVPELNAILEDDYKQKLLTLIPFDTYDLISSVPVSGPEDIRGKKVGGAGANLFWIEKVGANPVTITGPEVYTSFQSGLFDGLVGFVSIVDSLKLYDVAPYYTQVGFGAMSVLSLNVNIRRYEQLPEDMQRIISEVGAEMEQRSGAFTQEVYERTVGIVETNGANVHVLSEEQRTAWATLLANEPTMQAQEIQHQTGVPMVKAMESYLRAAEELGYEWPVRFRLSQTD